MATDEIKDVTGYYKWVAKWKAELKAMGEAFTTSKQTFAEDWWRIHERRENRDMPLPDGVAERRRQQSDLHLSDSLNRVEQKLERIERNTEDVPWLSKFVANLFKYGGGQAELKYPSKKK